MSEATEDSLIPASSSSFSSRWTSRPRSRVIAVRVRVRSRSCRIGSGGTNEPRTRPCAPSWASQVASETSVLRPGRFFTCRALTSSTSNAGVLEQVVERLPVVPGGLHHRTGDPLGDQVLTQREDLVGGRAPRGHRLDRLAATRAGDPDADLGVLLGDVQPRAPRRVRLPSLPPASSSTDHRCPPRGGQGETGV